MVARGALDVPPSTSQAGGGSQRAPSKREKSLSKDTIVARLLDRQRSEVRVVREVATDAHVDEQAPHDPGVIRTGRQDDRGRRGEPGVDPIERCVDAER